MRLCFVESRSNKFTVCCDKYHITYLFNLLTYLLTLLTYSLTYYLLTYLTYYLITYLLNLLTDLLLTLLTYLLTYLLISWSRVLLENLTGFQLVKKFPEFYTTRRFIPHSQVPASCDYPEPARSSPYPHIPLPENPS
jgi:hypothetical protein